MISLPNRVHEFRTGRLITSIDPADTGRLDSRKFLRTKVCRYSPGMLFALLSPGPARRFPFSAPLRTRRGVSFRRVGWRMGRLPNEDQSQRALGIDTRNRAVFVFRRGIARRAGL